MECALENPTNMICLKQPPASQYTFSYVNVNIVNQLIKQNFRTTCVFFSIFFSLWLFILIGDKKRGESVFYEHCTEF